MARPELPVWIGTGFPVFFVGLWTFVMLVMSFLSGWRALAKCYPAANEPDVPSEGFHFRSGTLGRGTAIGRASYNGCLNLRSGSAGLRLGVLLPFRFFHPPIFVPWSDITTEAGRRLFVFSYVRFRFRGVPGVSLELSEGLASKILAASRSA